jgi:alpha-L-fucosidase 2
MNRRPLLFSVCTLVVALLPCGVASTLAGGLKLWHDFPVQDWQQHAFFLGGGRLGATVFGGIDREVIQFNEDSLWTGDLNLSGDYASMGAYQNFGQVVVQLEHGQAVPKLSCPSGQVPAVPARERIEHSVDGNPRTKWCVEHEGRPLVWQVDLPKDQAVVITKYALVSADDVPSRDPREWKLEASTDQKTWVVLDHRKDEIEFEERHQRREFQFENSTPFRHYRLRLLQNHGASHYQLAEIQLDGVQWNGLSNVENYRRELDLETAVHTVSYQLKGVTFQRRTLASFVDHVIVSHWTADAKGQYSGRVQLQDAHGALPVGNGNEIICSGKLNNGLRYQSQLKLIHGGGDVSLRDQGLEFQNCDSLTILLAAGTDYVMDPRSDWRGEAPAKRLSQHLRASAGKSVGELFSRHIDDHQSLFQRVVLDVGASSDERRQLPTDRRIKAYQLEPHDPDLEEALFQYGRYLLIACSRPGSLPANLQGLWNHVNDPPWHSDYHTNINIQMNYWLAEPANLSECHEPLIALTDAMRPAARAATRESFGDVRGFTYRTSHNIFGGQGWKWNIPGSAWYCQHLWEHYAFSGDKQYLRDTAYPIIKEVCQYWEDHLKELPDGKLVAPNGWSPEHGPREDGVAHDQQIIWDLFTNLVEAADALEVDQEYRDRIADLRDRLDGPRIGRWGQLQEWREDRDDPNDRHRHTSHLFALYPGRQITALGTPRLAKAAMISLQARGETGDSRRSWTWPWRCAMWARLLQADQAHHMIVGLLQYNTLPNLITTHPPLQLDGSFGITAGICEMLLQSHTGEVHLLPACPQAWPKGHVTGLRARGGFIVDASWQGQRVTKATIRSLRGGKLVVVHGDQKRQFETKPGDATVVRFGSQEER